METIKIFTQHDKKWLHVFAKIIQLGSFINGNDITVNHAGIIFKYKDEDLCLDIRKLQGVKIKKWKRNTKKKINYIFDTKIPIIDEVKFMDFIQQYKYYKYSIIGAISSFRFKSKKLQFLNIILSKIKNTNKQLHNTFCSNLTKEICKSWANKNGIEISGILKNNNVPTPQDLYNYYVKIDNKTISKKFH